MSELAMDWWVAQSPERVFAAIEDPLQMRRWYGAPPGGQRLGEEGDAGAGEPFRVNLLDAKGRPRVQMGRILKVYPAGRGLLMELSWDGGDFGSETTRVSIGLEPSGDGTHIEVRQGPFSSPEVQEAYRAYWEVNVGRLLRVVSGEAVPCFEEFWEESEGFADPLGMAAYTVLVGMREAGASPEALAQLEETLYTHLARVPEDTARVLAAVLRARLQGTLPGGG